MNCSNATTTPSTTTTSEVPYFKAKCNRAGIHVPGDNPTPSEIIPIIQQRLAAHQNHRSKTTNPWTGDYAEWKAKHDDLTQFLAELEAELVGRRCPQRAASGPDISNNPDAPSVHGTSFGNSTQPTPAKNQNNFSPKNTGQTNQSLPTQHNSNWPDCGQTLANTGQSLPNDGQQGPDSCQPLPNTDQPSATTNAKQNDRHLNDDDLEHDEGDEEDEHENEDRDELDFEAESAGYANHAELMAEAAADLQAALKKRNKFDALSPEAQAAIITMLDKYDSRYVAKLLVKPPPEGMNFKISKSGLNYFRRRYEKTQAQRRATENAKAAADLLDKSEDPDKAFQQTLERLLRLRTLTTVSEPDAPIETVDELINALTKLRKQALAERKQLHAEGRANMKPTLTFSPQCANHYKRVRLAIGRDVA
ncbi:MAG TPA: hypothetical protein VM680_06830 [Verrucomicrobiae bacterium]|nr:hypothetical protein [Verrucomicrobiae bacterium]